MAKRIESHIDEADKKEAGVPECFLIMPISDPEGYIPGHFQHVFDDLFSPACEMAGYKAVRADGVRETNMIHLDILQKIIHSPMAICDLSSRNPNVLFELGLRQAFDKPVVLVQERGTPKIFDIAPLRFTEYRRDRIYHEVIEDQKNIADALVATAEAYNKGRGINSIIHLLELTKPATIVETQEANRDPAYQLIRDEIASLKDELRTLAYRKAVLPKRPLAYQSDLNAIGTRISKLMEDVIAERKNGTSDPALRMVYKNIRQDVSRLKSIAKDSGYGVDQDFIHLDEGLQFCEIFLRDIDLEKILQT